MNINPPAATPVVLPFTNPKAVTSQVHAPRRLPGVSWMGDVPRNHLVAMLGEFAGTFLFLFFAFSGTQVANMWAGTQKFEGPNPSVLLYIALAFGFSLAVNVWVFFRISGGAFNPAVTLALCLIGAIGWVRGVLVAVSQILGGIAAAAVVSGLYPGGLLVRTSLSPGTSLVRGVFIEMFLTCQLVFTILMLAAEKHRGTFLAPIGIGLALFIAEMAGVYWTGGSLNPARSFGPEVAAGSFKHDHWVYWVGPFLGALLAVLFYRLIKILEYETANPGQDADHEPGEVSQFDGAGDPISPGARPWSKGHGSFAQSSSEVGSGFFGSSRSQPQTAGPNGSNSPRAIFARSGRFQSTGTMNSFAGGSVAEKGEIAPNQVAIPAPA